jgi:hypothetical protein
LNSAWYSGPVVHDDPDSYDAQPVSTATVGNWVQDSYDAQPVSTATVGNWEQDGEGEGFKESFLTAATPGTQDEGGEATSFEDSTTKNERQNIEAGVPSHSKDTNQQGHPHCEAREVKVTKSCGNCNKIG